MNIPTSPSFLNPNFTKSQRDKAQSNVRFGHGGASPHHPHNTTNSGSSNMTGGASNPVANQSIDGRKVGTMLLFVFGGIAASTYALRLFLKSYYKRQEAQAAAQRQPADVENNVLDENPVISSPEATESAH